MRAQKVEIVIIARFVPVIAIKFGLSTFILILLLTAAFGQAARSPFSTFGIGEPYGSSLIHNQGMAGTGVAQPQYWFLNNQNPALLVFNYYTVIASGLLVESKTIQGDTTNVKSTGGNLNYLAAAFPVKPGKWTTSVGLMPFTNVNYKFIYYDSVRDNNNNVVDTIAVQEQGSGGLNQLYWSNGYRLHKNWAIGLKAAYIFSSIENDFANTLINVNQPVPFLIAVKEQTYVNDFQFTGGLSFSKDSLGKRNNIIVSAGLTYSFASNLKARKTTTYERRTASGNPLTLDTLVTYRGKISIPSGLQAGFSVSKSANWSAAVEFGMQNWADFNSLNEDDLGSLGRAWRVAFGGEYTPDYLSSRFFDRVTYRAGFKLEHYPFLINNNQLKDFGINFGFSLPAGRSSIDLAFSTGKRGNRSENVLEETYFKVYFGLTFNDQWFVRRKFD
ncbi:MAG: hypothetical protein HRU69_02015 [Flammeovirgaceae bacterium]|nr:MAG: hypothetical protein HRU69_02015 [Flammeovirgaceae bacterium]